MEASVAWSSLPHRRTLVGPEDFRAFQLVPVITHGLLAMSAPAIWAT
jgi:hypothetical protein